MKYTYLLSLVILILFLSTNDARAQYGDEKYVTRPIKEKDVLIDVYTGYPNWGSYYFESYIEENSFNLKDANSVPHIGGRFEFILSEEFGFTVDALFDSWGGAWSNLGLVADTSGIMYTEEVNNSFKVNRLKVQFGITYHLDELTVENLDVYAGLAVGSNKLWVTDEIEDTNFNLRSENYFQRNSGFINSPISVRARAGGRYFFKENVALNVELSLGGPLITGGLSFLLK